ncbi:hypothetical protein C8Q72DRAFT_580446 [Fomitopsis betulina]|nr:hypothetical protein C8Q72DRAFT_580446 [Fomitopsis betulina]
MLVLTHYPSASYTHLHLTSTYHPRRIPMALSGYRTMAASWRRIYQFPYLFQLVFVFALMRVLAISVALNRRILDPHRWVYDPHYPIPPIKHVFFPELYGTGGAIIMAFQYIGMFLLIDVSWIFGRRADCKSHLYGYAWRCVIPLVLMSVVERFVVAVDGFQVLDVVPVCIGTCALSFVIWPIQRLIMSNRDSHIDAAKRFKAIYRAVQIVDSLPVVAGHNVSPNVCPKCSTPFRYTPGSLVRLPCGHMFCKKCIFQSILKRDACCPSRMCRLDFGNAATTTDYFCGLWASLRLIRRAVDYLVNVVAVISTGFLNTLSFVTIRVPRTILSACCSMFGYIMWLLSYLDLDELHDVPLSICPSPTPSPTPSPVIPDNGRGYTDSDLDIVKR